MPDHRAIPDLMARIERLEARVEELERRLRPDPSETIMTIPQHN